MRKVIMIGVGLACALQTLPASADFREACNTASLCSGVEPGGGRLIKCLKEHKSKLSTKCKTALGEFFLNQPVHSAHGGGAANAGGGEQGSAPDGSGAQQPDGR